VEGLATPFRAKASEFYDEAKGVYCFVLDEPLPGPHGQVRLKIGQRTITIMLGISRPLWTANGPAE